MELLYTDSLSEAGKKLFEASGDIGLETEKVFLADALGRILGADVWATEPVPSFRRSTMDGYALLAQDTYGIGEAAPGFFKIVGQVAIEEACEIHLRSGEAVRLQTGSMVPANATAVLMAEYAEEYAAGKLAAYRAVSPGENIIEAGEDVKAGTCLMRRGRRLASAELGTLAAMGMTQVTVYQPLKVTVISTGNELADAGQPLLNGQIRDINSYTLAAEAKKQGMKALRVLRVRDEEKALYEAVKEASEDSDLVLLSGGSSKGNKDYTKQILETICGRVLTHGIAVKPGKPTILAVNEKTRTVYAGLPGHPLAAYLMFHLVILSWYRERMGTEGKLPVPAVLSENVSSNQGRETCLLVKLCREEAGLTAKPVYAKSGSISCLLKADGYIMIPRSWEGLKKGERVWVERLE